MDQWSNKPLHPIVGSGAVLFKGFVFFLLACALAGCTTSPIPKGYTGPTATISDSTDLESRSRSLFFFVAEIDGAAIDNSLRATRSANYGRGFSISPMVIERQVPAKRVVLQLQGRVAYGAPIQEIFNAGRMYVADETIEVELQPQGRYVVRGELTEQRKAVWLEDEKTGERVGRGVTKP